MRLKAHVGEWGTADDVWRAVETLHLHEVQHGIAAAYNLAWLPGVVPILTGMPIPPLPCWLAVHREIRGNPLVRRTFDFLAEQIPQALAGAGSEAVNYPSAAPLRPADWEE